MYIYIRTLIFVVMAFFLWCPYAIIFMIDSETGDAMKRMCKGYPYILGLLVGFLTLPVFLAGFNLQGEAYVAGRFLMALAMLLWPLLILSYIVLAFSVYRRDETRRRQWYRAMFLPPVGAIIATIAINVLETLS